MSDDVALLGAAEQSWLIATRALSPVDLVRVSLDRIERYDAKLRAYVTVCADAAMAAAREAECEIVGGRYRGPLHGLPFGVKDQMHAAGVRTTLGSRATGHQIATEDACCVARLKAAGAILIGKENLQEFGKGGTHDFPFGQPRNPSAPPAFSAWQLASPEPPSPKTATVLPEKEVTGIMATLSAA